MNRAQRRQAAREAARAAKHAPASRPEPSVQSFSDWARSLTPPDCTIGHGPMVWDEGGGEEYGSGCGCEGREAWFYCEECRGDDGDDDDVDFDNYHFVKQLTYRDPRCDLAEAEHE